MNSLALQAMAESQFWTTGLYFKFGAGPVYVKVVKEMLK